MGIRYIDGMRLRNGVVAAAQRVLEVQERINKINVFPVADGDTGTNMALTLKQVAEGAINAGKLPLSAMSSRLAELALMGARGNSGAVLAQFFQGVADGFAGHRRVGQREFAASMNMAVEYAELAFSQPQEGTILTVMRDWASHLTRVSEPAAGFAEMLRDALAVAHRSLRDTPKKLKVLARAGVVDAGAQGFVNMLEGIGHFLETGELNWSADALGSSQSDTVDVSFLEGTLKFRFCTECLLDGDGMDLAQVRAAVQELGNSLVIAGNTHKLRVHIHTNEPQTLFDTLARFGVVSQTKKEDMQAQQDDKVRGADQTSDIALFTDSSCDLPLEYLIRHKINLIPVTVTFGHKTYLDRINITSEQVYRKMAEGHFPKTSQPLPASFLQAYTSAAEHHAQGLAVLLSSGLSGTYQAGLSAGRQVQKLDVTVFDSRNTAAGLGFQVKVAAEAVAEGQAMEEILRRLELARHHIQIFAYFPTIEYLVRGGRVGKLRGAIARFLNLVPIITLNREGKAVNAEKVRPGPGAYEKLLKLCKTKARGLTHLELMVCHAAAEEKATALAQDLARHFALESIDVLAVSPTLGAHAGPGAVLIGIHGYPPGVRNW